MWMSDGKDSTDQQRWVWTKKVSKLVWVKSAACGELTYIELRDKTLTVCAQSPEMGSVHDQTGVWSVMSDQSEPDCVPIYNSREGEQCCAAPPVPQADLTFTSHHSHVLWALWGSLWFLLGGCVHHLFVVRLMNLLTEILTMIWENQWNKKKAVST